MATPKKTINNPHGLTKKQLLTIASIVSTAKNGGKINLTEAHNRIYDVKSRDNARKVASINFHKIDYRMALLEGLEKQGILGANGKVSQRLAEGLDARTETDKPDFNNRLKYAQEINKVAGVYAPEKRQMQKLSINLDLKPEEMKKRIREIEEELRQDS